MPSSASADVPLASGCPRDTEREADGTIPHGVTMSDSVRSPFQYLLWPYPQRTRSAITADFPGAAVPPGSRVRFTARGASITGVVAELQAARAVVLAGDAGRWQVPYRLLEVVDRVPERECTLADVEMLARRLLARHQAQSGLGTLWTFGFDLSTSRAGVCRYRDQRIDLSVSYCLRATRADIENTLLHEIAHAIVGIEHGHDAVWKAKAHEIGCTAERCHGVTHTVARWVGECGCRRQWFRQRLSRRLRTGAICKACGRRIEWRWNTDGAAD